MTSRYSWVGVTDDFAVLECGDCGALLSTDASTELHDRFHALLDSEPGHRIETVQWWQAVGRKRDTGTHIAKAENDSGVISLYGLDDRKLISWSEDHFSIPTVDVLAEDGGS